MSPLPSKSRLHGQSLIGILIAIALFALLSNAIFTLVTSSYKLTGFTRARITARHLAQDRIEFIRNLPYDNVGTQGGIPVGPLEQYETMRINGLNFTIKTSIVYIDDTFDFQAPSDLLPTDYKRVRVEVSWEGVSASNRNPVILVSDISPKGVETTAGGGTISILVFDSNGEPVPQADVTIVTTDLNPNINLQLQTQNNGRIILPGAPACVSCYQITVTKTNFSTDRTYSTSEVANPIKPHATVIERDLTETSFAIDRLSTLNITTYGDRESGFPLFPNGTFIMRGDKTIGTNSSNQPVYKYDEAVSTNNNANLQIELEWDNYTLTRSQTYSIAGTHPINPVTISPNTDTDLKISLKPFSSNTLLGIFTQDGITPIASVSATLAKNSDSTMLLSGQSDDPDFGQVYFDGLDTNEVYAFTATASGFIDYTESITAGGDLIDRVILVPQ